MSDYDSEGSSGSDGDFGVEAIERVWGTVVVPDEKDPNPFTLTGLELHVTNAALPPSNDSSSEGDRVTVMMQCGILEAPHAVCTLIRGRTEQVTLDLTLFEMDDKVTFTAVGSDAVHLSGRVIIDPLAMGDSSDDEDEDGDEEDEEAALEALKNAALAAEAAKEEQKKQKAKAKETPKKTKKAEKETPKKADAKKTPKKADAKKTPKKAEKETPKKTPKKETKKRDADGAGAGNGSTEPKSKKKRRTDETPEPVAARKPQVKTMAGGLKVRDDFVGLGAKPVKGKRVSVKYVGSLPNGKVFDKSGNRPFTFRLGIGEVIKGWDLGVSDMRVGGKRHLTIPAKLAYGRSGVPGTIPPNSTLHFDVELVSTK